MTGVGIWFSAALVNPAAIGSLIRVFFWAWFVEWLVFVAEVGLILIYYLTWRGWGRRHKRLHIVNGREDETAALAEHLHALAYLGIDL